MLRPPPANPGAHLRQMIADGCVTMPGVFNALSALSAVSQGSTALYISGAGVTNADLGLPDIALASLDEFARTAARVCEVVDVPVIADADTGFGETANVRRTVIEMERAGLAGIHIEDQVSPKRCGHLDGKEVIEAARMAEKIGSAVDAKRSGDFLIIARTDARGVEGLESAIQRAQLYVQSGADAIFPEGLTSEAEFEQFRRAVPGPLLANMTEFGKTPLISAVRFAELGYQMVIFPMTALRAALKTLDEVYATLIATGSQVELMDRLRTRQGLYDTLGYDAYIQADARLRHGYQA